MDHDTPLREAQNAQAPISSQDPSETVPHSRNDKWNAYKGEIYGVYIQQNNTLETTMQIIEDQGGPKARRVILLYNLFLFAYPCIDTDLYL
jgi:hypothetical protein